MDPPLNFAIPQWNKDLMRENYRNNLRNNIGDFNTIWVLEGYDVAVFARPDSAPLAPGDETEARNAMYQRAQDIWENDIFPRLAVMWRSRFLIDHRHWIPQLQDGLNAADTLELEAQFFNYLRDYWSN